LLRRKQKNFENKHESIILFDNYCSNFDRLQSVKDANDATLAKIQKYEEDLAKIQASTQITDFEKLIDVFIKNEERNFTTFKYVNDLSNEIEALEKAIAELKVSYLFKL